MRWRELAMASTFPAWLLFRQPFDGCSGDEAPFVNQFIIAALLFAPTIWFWADVAWDSAAWLIRHLARRNP